MTTALHRLAGGTPTSILVRATVGSLAMTIVLAVVALVVSGGAGLWSVLIGAGVVLAVFVSGTLAVNAMSSRSAEIALMVALVTYTGQVMVILGLFIVFSAADLLDGTLSRGWLAASVVASALVWSTCQIVLASAARIPLYDLGHDDPHEGSK